MYVRGLQWIAAVSLLFACLLAPLALGAEPATETVAEVGGEAITMGDLEAMLAPQLRQLEVQRHELLERALEAAVAERLVAQEAKRTNTTVAALVAKAEGDVSVSDAEVDAWYTQNAARVRQPKAEVAAQIRDHLADEKRRAGRDALVGRLRGEHGARVLLEPLRIVVDSPASAAKGPADAPVTVVEFSDFQCPACKSVAPVIDRLREAYPEQVRVVFRHFPLRSIHPQAQLAAEAATCAREQREEAFWTMHDALFAGQSALGRDDLVARAGSLGLDEDTFVACLDGGSARAAVDTDVREGEQAGVNSTPSIFVNGRPVALLRNQDPVETLSAVVDDELRRAKADREGR